MGEHLQKLGKFLQSLEQEARVCITDEKNLHLKVGCETIVESLLQAIHEKEPRFEFAFHGTGSSYDGVKVGQPDEFDFIAEIKGLSKDGAVDIVKASDPGFVKIEMTSMEMKKMWRDCLVLPHTLHPHDSEMIYPVKIAHQLDRMELTETDISNSHCVLAPFKIQKVFTTLVNECMASLQLPADWEHHGYKKPEYSGCKRHGPAAMLAFDYIGDEKAVRVNLDITVGIAVPLPTNVENLNLYVAQNIKGNEMMEEKLRNVFASGPQLHVIPLYSSALVKTQKFENKYAWRISCSVLETIILDSFPDDGPKMCLRMIKAVRDKFLLADEKRIKLQKREKVEEPQSKEESRQEEKLKQGQAENPPQESGNTENLEQKPFDSLDETCSLSSDIDLENPMPPYEYIEKIQKIHTKWVDIRNTYYKVSSQQGLINPDPPNLSRLPFGPPSYEAMVAAEQKKESSFQDLRKAAMKIEREDISEMFSDPDSGEYFGPKAYMSSIEIKTYVLRLIGKHPESSFWSMENVVKHVNDFLRCYHTILLERRMMKNFFFNSMVCAPISEEQRLVALRKFNRLFQELNKAMSDISA